MNQNHYLPIPCDQGEIIIIMKSNLVNDDQVDYKGCTAIEHVEEKDGTKVNVEDGPETWPQEEI